MFRYLWVPCALLLLGCDSAVHFRLPPLIQGSRASTLELVAKEAAPVLEPGPYRSWDERGIADPYVIQVDGYFYLYYTGLDRAQQQQLGMARSRDGIHWQKNAANPILELGADPMDEAGLGEPA